MTYPEYPFQNHYLDINGLKLHYLDEGPADAEMVVMLHGNPTWSYYYRHLVTALRREFRCIVPDHMGMGLSEKPPAGRYPFTLDTRVSDLDELIKQFEPGERITLVLHDWGGMIGMAWAVRNAARVKRLVIFNTAAFHLPPGKHIPWQLRLSRLPVLNAILNQGLNLFVRGAARACVTRKPLPSAIAAAYKAPYDSWHARLAVRRFVEDIPLHDNEVSWPLLDEVDGSLHKFADHPMLICWGMRDFVFDGDFLREWERRFPAAGVHRFTDAGHYVLEDARGEIIPLVRTFLGRQAGC